MTKLTQLTTPVMRRSASFNADHTTGQGFKEREQLRTFDLLVDDLATGG